MKTLICTLLFAFAASAQAQPWQPSAGHTQIPIWPGAVPDAQKTPQPEDSKVMTDPLVAGKPWIEVSNVSKPTMTVYSPKGKNTGAAFEYYSVNRRDQVH